MPFTQKEWKKQLVGDIQSELHFWEEHHIEEDWEWENWCNARLGSKKMEKCKANFQSAGNAVEKALDKLRGY
jgi:hypothetical protein